MSIRMTLWGRQAENYNASTAEDGSEIQPVIAFKGVKVGDFGGRSLSMQSSASMVIEPDIPESHALRGWYDSQGASSSFSAFTSNGAGAGGAGSAMRPENFKNLGQVRDEMIGTRDEPDFYCVRATVTFIRKENLSYPACPKDRCNKKVTLESDNEWRCEKCDRTYDHAEYR